MNNWIAFAALLLTSSLALAEEQVVRLDSTTTASIELTCRSDEFAMLQVTAEKLNSESVYKASVECRPAVCQAVNNGGKISVARRPLIPKGKAYTGPYSYQVLESDLNGDKETALTEARKFMDQGLCQEIDYTYTNRVLKFINSL